MVEGELQNKPPERWNFKTHFREYALLLGRKGKDGLESIDKFPKTIELDTQWHTALDKIRVETKSGGEERYAVIGFREDSRDFYFPEVSAIGEPGRVPRQAIGELRWKMWEKYKITSIIGDFHTHPQGSAFSPEDLYNLLNKLTATPYMKGLANEQENIFAFRTRETFMVSKIDTPSKGFSSVFTDHWLEKAGFKYNEARVHLVRIEPAADIWKANLGIAEAHRLALYRGKPGQDLRRMYP